VTRVLNNCRTTDVRLREEELSHLSTNRLLKKVSQPRLKKPDAHARSTKRHERPTNHTKKPGFVRSSLV
jgi:hypothetical protein